MSNREREGREEKAQILMGSPQWIAHEYWGLGRERKRGGGVTEINFIGFFWYNCRCGLYECGRKLLNALPDIGEGEEEGTDEYWVSYNVHLYVPHYTYIYANH